MWKYTTTKDCNDFLLSLNLIDCDNPKMYIKTLYSISNRVENNYRIFKIKKNNGKYRVIYEPNGCLKHIQKMILKNVLEERIISEYAKAYHKGLSLKDNAYPHLGKKTILKLDIKDFFNNISFINVYKNCFPRELYPKSVGVLLTRLCTYQDHLVQGTPTASYISNLVMREFDCNIGQWANKQNISYTRYSDDMTFSGDFDSSVVIKKVSDELKKIGLRLNYKKINVINSSSRQEVCGVVVNKKLQVNTLYRKKIRQEIYYIKKYGLKSHLERCSYDNKSYIRSLYGKILFVLQINPDDKEFIEYKDYLFESFIK